MRFVRRLACLLFVAIPLALQAQSTTPAVSHTLPAQVFAPNGAIVSIDLRNYFHLPGVTGQVVRFDTVLGKFNVELLANDAPVSVANFRSYVAASRYTNTLIHRSDALNGNSNRIIQGGGYTANFFTISHFAPIVLEYKLANARGTLAMARGPELNSATSEWFFNIDDNTTVLSPGIGGGYAVFGRVLGTGMTIVDAIAALPTYNAGSPFNTIPLRDIRSGQEVIEPANKILVNSVTEIPVYPATNGAAAVLAFSVINPSSSAVAAAIDGSTLTLTPAGLGSGNVVARATDTNGNSVDNAFDVRIGQLAATPGGTVSLGSASAGSYQWQRNGSNLAGATAQTLALADVQPASTGLYYSGTGPVAQDTLILGLATTAKVLGTGTELDPKNIVHPNGNTFDQVLLTGTAETLTADPGQVTRTSYIDLDDDIVQVEFSGPGTLSLTLDNPSGPALPVNYNQAVSYMKGHATIVITGATEATNVSVFSVGRLTAFDPTGGFNFLQPISPANNPANNGSQLFVGHSGTAYDGIADLAVIAIASSNGKFGGVRTAGANFFAAKGLTGLYAPGVQFTGPVYLGNITASADATPVLLLGSAAGNTWITGGDLQQANARPVQVSGLTRLEFKAGTDSHGHNLPAQTNKAVLQQNGADVTSQIVVNP